MWELIHFRVVRGQEIHAMNSWRIEQKGDRKKQYQFLVSDYQD
jgi:hypothetical protein